MMLMSVRLGQASAWWPQEGVDAVSTYEGLMARVPLIADADARGEILKWVGRADIPGSPAERYNAVSNGLVQGGIGDDVMRGRLDQLKAINAELSARVSNAGKAYGMLSAADAAGSTPEAEMAGLCMAGGIALLGLVIVPLVLVD
jgi:hypothetical protein